MKISKHFNSKEFDCNDGTPYPKEWYPRLVRLCEALELIRGITNQPMTITSGYRTPEWNRKVGGKRASKHLEGMAADIKLKGIGPKRLFKMIDIMQRDGVIPRGGLFLYPTFIHVDIRGIIAR